MSDLEFDSKEFILVSEENVFLRALKNLEKYEDPLQIYLDFLKWADLNCITKRIEILEKLTKDHQRLKQYNDDERYIRKWILYANSCKDWNDVFNFMQEHDIGQNSSIFFEHYSVFYESKRNFLETNKILMRGIIRKVNPYERITSYIKNFEKRMRERLERDFYSHNNFLTENNEEKNEKKRKMDVIPSNKKNNSSYSLKKFKFEHSTLKRGNVEIFIDEENREKIIISTQLVKEYDELTKKYNFSICDPFYFIKQEEQNNKPLSWISQEIKSNLKIESIFQNDDLTNKIKNSDSQKKKIENNIDLESEKLLQKENLKFSFENKSIDNSKHENLSSIKKINNDSSAKFFVKNSIPNQKKSEEKINKESLLDFFEKKIERNNTQFFFFPHNLTDLTFAKENISESSKKLSNEEKNIISKLNFDGIDNDNVSILKTPVSIGNIFDSSMKKQFDLSNEIEFFKFCCSEEKSENNTNSNSNEKAKIIIDKKNIERKVLQEIKIPEKIGEGQNHIDEIIDINLRTILNYDDLEDDFFLFLKQKVLKRNSIGLSVVTQKTNESSENKLKRNMES